MTIQTTIYQDNKSIIQRFAKVEELAVNGRKCSWPWFCAILQLQLIESFPQKQRSIALFSSCQVLQACQIHGQCNTSAKYLCVAHCKASVASGGAEGVGHLLSTLGCHTWEKMVILSQACTF